MGEARHFKFGAQIDIDEHHRTRDRLPPKGMYLWSRDFFDF